MLIQPDINELGDKRLDPKESVAREREELLKIASTRKIAGQEELEDAERSAGPRLAYTEIIRRIQVEAPSLKVLEGAPGSVALYFPRTRKELEEMDAQGGRDQERDIFFHHFKYVGGMEKKDMPEFAHVILDTSNLPVREYRGWRSVVIGLIKQGVLSYRAAVSQFGEPRGVRAGRWHEQLRPYKQ